MTCGGGREVVAGGWRQRAQNPLPCEMS